MLANERTGYEIKIFNNEAYEENDNISSNSDGLHDIRHTKEELEFSSLQKAKSRWKCCTIVCILAIFCLTALVTFLGLKEFAIPPNGNSDVERNDEVQDNRTDVTKEIICRRFPCRNEGRCIVIDGDRICICPPGIHGLNCEETPCSTTPCLYNGTCEILGANYKCLCQKGFSGTKCEVTPCTQAPCKNNGQCLITGEDRRCLCKSGFNGPNCEDTPCSSNPCLNDGKCFVTDEGFACICQTGYAGTQCQETPCSSSPCKNGGECTIKDHDFMCRCPTGYSGLTCEVTACSESPCDNGGVCLVSGNNYTCSCPPGYSGNNCEDSPCSSSPCKNNGSCIVNGSNYTCICLDGYSGSLCEESICMSSPCRNKGTCTVNGGSFTCTCTNEFTGTYCQNTVCDLDNDLNCFFTQDLDDGYDWTRHSGSTLSLDTGPSSAYEGKYYFYFETSSPVASGGIARLTSRSFKTASYGCLRFFYHMYGVEMGSLKVYQNGLLRWNRHGDQGNQWRSASVNLFSSNKTQVTFEASNGISYTSDIAIDSMQILSSSC